ncbi:MAG: glycosyltransferase family 4 protein [Phycisphaerae bacterium]|nr:glycosyltransferase family 4 protein [Phycisphaerae bacterium]
MKVLMLSHEFPPVGGGASPVVCELAKQLVRLGHSVDLVTMHYDALARHEVIEGVNVYRTPAIRKRPDIGHAHELATYFPGAFFRTLSLIRRNRYDLIHCHFMVPGGPLAWAVGSLTRTPFLITCHGSDVPKHNPDRFVLLHKLIAPAWRFLARRAPALVSPSAALKETILHSCPQAKVRVIPNGIHVRACDPQGKGNRILMCSRIFAFKGFQYAFEAIREMDLDWQVDVVGDGPYLSVLKEMAAGLKTPIRFWGWLDKKDPRLAELFDTASIFIFPSEADNFPSVLLEAMAAGLAIITTTAGGCPEVVGEAGLLVQPRDPAGIRARLQELVQSAGLRAELANAALERVRLFSWPSVAGQYVACYEEIAAMSVARHRSLEDA